MPASALNSAPLGGFVGSFVLEKFLKAHHGGHGLLPEGEEDGEGEGARPLSGMVLLGDGVHNFLDGW